MAVLIANKMKLQTENLSYKTYQTLAIDVDESTISTNAAYSNAPKISERRVFSVLLFTIFTLVLLTSYLFYGYVMFRGLVVCFLEKGSSVRRLVDSTTTSSCTLVNATGMTTIGAVAGSAAVLGAFLLVGLTPVGPMAGAWFAVNMGAGLEAGSLMSAIQAAAMTGTAYGTGAAIGATLGAATTCT